MADFYHDHNKNFSNHGYGFMADQSVGSLLNDERDCFNATELEAVPSRMGQLFLIILYSLTSLLALMGNVTVIVVEICGKESAHNIRKYLINLAVSDITIGVLCVPFTYTDFMLGQWIFPHWLCPTAQFVQLLSVFVTSLTLTFIGIERYMATLYPFSSLHHWLECHTHIMLALTWVFGVAYACIPLENTAVRSFNMPSDNETYYECTYDIGLSDLKRRLFVTSNIVLTFLLPLLVLIFSYTAIMRKLILDERKFNKSSQAYGIKFKSATTSANSPSTLQVGSAGTGSCSETDIAGNVLAEQTKSTVAKEEEYSGKNFNHTALEPVQSVAKNVVNFSNSTNISNNNANSKKSGKESEKYDHQHQLSTSNLDLRKSTPFNYRSKTIKMMFTVILLYGICWAPIKLYQLLMDYGYIEYCTERELYATVCLFFLCHWMAMANSFVNPIIYSFMSKSFRNDFRKITQSFRQTFSKNLNQLSIKTESTDV